MFLLGKSRHSPRLLRDYHYGPFQEQVFVNRLKIIQTCNKNITQQHWRGGGICVGAKISLDLKVGQIIYPCIKQGQTYYRRFDVDLV